MFDANKVLFELNENPILGDAVKEAVPAEHDYLAIMEESGEISQACAKILRNRGIGYPTPQSEKKVRQNFIEELCDILCVVGHALYKEPMTEEEEKFAQEYCAYKSAKIRAKYLRDVEVPQKPVLQ